VLKRDETWEQHVVGTVGNESTRPLLAIDSDHRQLHVFFSAPCCSGGTIYTKTSSLDSIAFGPDVGTAFIRSTSNRLNNPASTKQNVTAASGLLVIASDDRNDRYMHNFETLDGPAVAQPSPAPLLPGAADAPAPVPGASAEPILFDDDFESGGLDRWSSVRMGPGSSVTVDTKAGRYGQAAVHLTASRDKGAFATARVVLPSPQAALTIDFDVKVHLEGPIGGNVPLLRVLDSDGKRLATIYRQNLADGRLWVGLGGDHFPTQAKVDLDTWGHLFVEIRPTGNDTGSTISVRLDGRLVGQVRALAFKQPTSIIQIGNESANQPFDLFIDDVRVSR
jgi:hypothetical protein